MRDAVRFRFTRRFLTLVPFYASALLLMQPQAFTRPIYFARYKAYIRI
jgi:hypothetical protein